MDKAIPIRYCLTFGSPTRSGLFEPLHHSHFERLFDRLDSDAESVEFTCMGQSSCNARIR